MNKDYLEVSIGGKTVRVALSNMDKCDYKNILAILTRAVYLVGLELLQELGLTDEQTQNRD